MQYGEFGHSATQRFGTYACLIMFLILKQTCPLGFPIVLDLTARTAGCLVNGFAHFGLYHFAVLLGPS